MLAGGGWLALGGGPLGGNGGSTAGVLEDFEDGSIDGWGGDTDALEVTSDAAKGSGAGRFAFAGHSKFWLDFEPQSPSEFSFWWKSGAVDDNELVFSLHEYGGDDWASYDSAALGLEVGSGNQPGVVVNPPFPNGRTYSVLTEQPQPDTWYEAVFSIDFGDGVFDVTLSDGSGVVGEVTGHGFGADLSAVDRLQVKNSMNWSGAAGYLDHVRAVGSE